MSQTIYTPITKHNSTVLGYPGPSLWNHLHWELPAFLNRGLDLENHEYLSVPACHPEDYRAGEQPGAYYRVRFRWQRMPWRGKRRMVEAVSPVMRNGRWHWRVMLREPLPKRKAA